jgi:hypothetical protein
MQLQQLMAPFVAWAVADNVLVGLLLSALAVFSPWGPIRFFWSLWRNAPRFAFGFDRIDDLIGDESGLAIKLTNVGGRVASDVQTDWVPESTCEHRPPAQPFTLLPGGEQVCEFTAVPIDLILRIDRSKMKRRVGSLIVTYRDGWLRRRVGRLVIVAKRNTGHAQTVFDLRPLPRKRLRDVVPAIGKWQDARAERQRVQRVVEKLAWARSYLAERGITVQQWGQDDDVFRRILGELQRRGWAWEYESSGSGYTVKIEKSWPPSTSQTFRVFADTREDVVMVALARAIQFEAERSVATLPGESLAAYMGARVAARRS